MFRAVRLVLLLGVILGVVLPKSTAALADIGVIDDRAVVICTGHGLVQVSLAEPAQGHDAAPDHDHACLLVHALVGAVAPAEAPWVRLSGRIRPTLAADLWQPLSLPRQGFARAPPRA